ncbi:MAG: tyrosine-type recombinase/integrase [Candidatus Hodarchaeota archaeon]
MTPLTPKELLIEYELILDNHLRPLSKEVYIQNLKHFGNYLETQGKTLANPTTIDVAKWLKHCKKTVKQTTLMKKFQAIRKYFAFLKRKKIISSEEFDYLAEIRPKRTKGDEVYRALSTNEIQQCLARIAHPTYRFLFLLGLNFGLRREEYSNLRLKDVNLKRRHLRVHGKGDKVRFIPITRQQVLLFERFFKQRKRDQVTHDHLIYTKRGKPVAKTISNYFAEMSKYAGVRFSSHDLRVTYTTRFWLNGGDIYTISKKLGHSKIDTTLSYLKPTEREIDRRYLEIAEEFDLYI